jgi:hemoglobin/transferrin/lactoferrin receptor protein
MNRKVQAALIGTGIILCPLLAQAQETDLQTSQKLTTDAVKVTATKVERPLEEIPYSVESIAAEEIQRKTAVGIAEALRDIPGVEVTDGSMAGSKRVSIRGETGARVLIMIDGQKISEQKSMDGAVYMIDPGLVERVEVIKGPASVLYGSEAIGGVVNIITKKGGEKPVQIETGINYDSSTDGWKENIALAGKINRFGYRLYGSYSDQGKRQSASRTLDNTAYREMNTKAYLDYQWDDATVAFSYENFKNSLDVYGMDPLTFPFTRFYQNLPTWNREKYSLSFDIRKLPAPLVKLSGNVFHQNTYKDFLMEMDMQPTANMNVEYRGRSKNDLDTIGAQLQADWLLFNDHYVVTGFDYVRDSLTADDFAHQQAWMQMNPMMPPIKIVDDGGILYRNKAENDTYAVYLQDEWSFAKNFMLTGGFRHTWVSTELSKTNNPNLQTGSHSDNSIVGSVGLTYSGIPDTTLRVLWAQGYRNATLQQLYIGTQHGDSKPTYGNTDLRPEESQNIEVGVRYDNGGFYLDTALFGNQTKNLITTGEHLTLGDAASQFINIDKSTSYGLDTSIGYRFAELGLNPYASIGFLKRRFESAGLKTWKTGRAAVQSRLGMRYDKEHSSSFGYYIDLFGRFADAADYEETAGNIERNPGWATLNLGGGIRFGNKQQHSFVINLNNLLDKEYKAARESIPMAGVSVAAGLNLAF